MEGIERWSRADVDLNLILPLTSCVASGKFLNLSEHGFPVCKNSDDEVCLGLLRESNGKVPESVCHVLCSLESPLYHPSPQPTCSQRISVELPLPSLLLCFRPNSAHRGQLRHSLTRPALSRPLVYGDYLQALGPVAAH